jgi:hypothetical protein
MLGECHTLLLPVTMQVESPNRWQWQPYPDTSYSILASYQILTSTDIVILGVAEDLQRHKQVSLKVSILVWRLLQ